MGTAHDWMCVAFLGVFWGGCMALSTGPRKARDGSKSGWSWPMAFVAHAQVGRLESVSRFSGKHFTAHSYF